LNLEEVIARERAIIEFNRQEVLTELGLVREVEFLSSLDAAI
jgi:hypothetical protein